MFIQIEKTNKLITLMDYHHFVADVTLFRFDGTISSASGALLLFVDGKFSTISKTFVTFCL